MTGVVALSDFPSELTRTYGTVLRKPLAPAAILAAVQQTLGSLPPTTLA